MPSIFQVEYCVDHVGDVQMIAHDSRLDDEFLFWKNKFRWNVDGLGPIGRKVSFPFSSHFFLSDNPAEIGSVVPFRSWTGRMEKCARAISRLFTRNNALR